MNSIQKERELFEATQNPIIFERIVYIEKANLFTMKDDFRDDLFTVNKCNELNFGWSIWQAAKAQAAQEWISVDDEPPTPNKTFSDAVIAWDGICVRRIPLCLFNSASEVTHWVPIPQPPKAQESAND